MNAADRHARASDLFHEALERRPDERIAWLDKVCEDPEARQQVRAMLKHHDEEETGPLDRPVFDRVLDEGGTDILDPMLGRTVGPWHIEGRLGEGGMGVVYRATRADGLYERTVALKLMRSGPDMHALRQRLASERQILARLEHHGIARLYDGGVTADGLPYLALELVEGEDIAAWAGHQKASLDECIRLFLQACDAVAYAHANLVIHRDLKPSNILVANGSNHEPHVKLLDFGIAKLTEQADTQGLTRTAAMGPMTPLYAAPEQLRGLPVSTRSDVYSLGVVLYQLLAGQRPYALSGKTAAEVERTVTEGTIPLPSGAANADRRKALRGDLDTIILKALAKEPERRYASAEALADDLRRHLEGLPVRAQVDSVGYRVRKFTRRHRTGVGATAAVLLGAIFLVGFYTIRLAAERDRAQDEADKATAVTSFLRSTLAAASPESGEAMPPSQVRIVDALHQASRQVESSFAGQPGVRAAVLHTLGQTYLELGLFGDAEPSLREALDLRDSLHANKPHPDQIETLDALGLLSMWRSSTVGGRQFFERSLDYRGRIYGLKSKEYARGLINIAEWTAERADARDAVDLARRALSLARETEGEGSFTEGGALLVLGFALVYAGEYIESDEILSSLYENGRDLVEPDDPVLAELLVQLATARILNGDFEAAAAVVQDALARRNARFDAGHPYLAEVQFLHAILLVEDGAYAEAEALIDTLIPIFRSGNPYSYSVHVAMVEHARARFEQGLLTNSDSSFEALAWLQDSLGADHGWTRHAERQIAVLR